MTNHIVILYTWEEIIMECWFDIHNGYYELEYLLEYGVYLILVVEEPAYVEE